MQQRSVEHATVLEFLEETVVGFGPDCTSAATDV